MIKSHCTSVFKASLLKLLRYFAQWINIYAYNSCSKKSIPDSLNWINKMKSANRNIAFIYPSKSLNATKKHIIFKSELAKTGFY